LILRPAWRHGKARREEDCRVSKHESTAGTGAQKQSVLFWTRPLRMRIGCLSPAQVASVLVQGALLRRCRLIARRAGTPSQ
jgi:hypothetical protein